MGACDGLTGDAYLSCIAENPASSEDTPRSVSNLQAVGFLSTGEQVFQNLDPDNPMGVGLFLARSFPSGQQFVRLTPGQEAEIAAAQAPRPSGNSGSSVPFSAPNIPGLIFNRAAGAYFLPDGSRATPQDVAAALSLSDGGSAGPRFTTIVDDTTGNLIRIGSDGTIVDTGVTVGFPGLDPAETRAEDRATRATEFAATHGLNERSQEFSEAAFGAEFGLSEQAQRFREFEAAQTRARQLQQDQLGAASQAADLISLTDPGALPAFLAAGGGLITNAIATGADALSGNALLPAARTFGVQDDLAGVDPSRFLFQPQPGSFSFTPTTTAGATPTAATPPVTAPAAAPASQPAGGRVLVRRPEDVTAEELAAFGQDVDTSQVPESAARSFLAGLMPATPAQHGFDDVVNKPTLFLAGEGDRPERVDIDPLDPRREFLPTVGSDPRLVTGSTGVGSNVIDPRREFLPTVGSDPRLVTGSTGATATSQPATGSSQSAFTSATDPNSLVLPSDASDIARVRALRERIGRSGPALGIDIFNVRFPFLPPSVQRRRFQQLQLGFGVQAADIAAEASRFRLGGLSGRPVQRR